MESSYDLVNRDENTGDRRFGIISHDFIPIFNVAR